MFQNYTMTMTLPNAKKENVANKYDPVSLFLETQI